MECTNPFFKIIAVMPDIQFQVILLMAIFITVWNLLANQLCYDVENVANKQQR